MPCFRPLEAWRGSVPTSNGKLPILFKPDGTTTHTIELPCGQCIGCRLDKSLEWATRCTHEAQTHQHNSFITLTYSQEHLPPDGSLCKPHVDSFIQKLRNTHRAGKLLSTSDKTRYYGCGEYGDGPGHRPHYHFILFGIDFQDREVIAEKEGIYTYTSELLQDIWPKGFVTTMDYDFSAAAYIARYTTKKVTGKKKDDHYQTTCPYTGEIINLQPEFGRMSLKPGIGQTWLNQYMEESYRDDYIVLKNKILKNPRYYDKQFAAAHGETALEEKKVLRKKAALKHRENNTPERLMAREKYQYVTREKIKRSYENEV